jgi:aspartyl-tRNA synthetase
MSQSTSLNGWKRSHRCNDLRPKDAGQMVSLMGWVQSTREHKNVIFVDLRDRDGVTQVVFDPDFDASPLRVGSELRNEFVVAIRGVVKARPDGMVNEKFPTGGVEVQVKEAKILNRCGILPFQITDETDANETMRLKYRYLDLRRPGMKQNILNKVMFVRAMRQSLEKRGFLDLETPMLYKSTPEGAREFLVPSRIHPGQFYALPQSPQLFKQTLMISGFDRYYQVVKCFRDEDLRADRQPEFFQIDCEMSFVEQDDVLRNFEESISEALRNFKELTIPTPFRQMKFQQAMDEYGVDKPDTRFELKLVDIAKAAEGADFKVFSEAVAAGGIVNCIVVPGAAEKLSRKDIDELTETAKSHGAKGLAWAKKKTGSGSESWQSPIAKFLSDEVVQKIEAAAKINQGDFVVFGAGGYDETKAALGAVRVQIGKLLKLADPKRLDFLWIVDFPLCERDKSGTRWVARHHPFTSPLPEDMHLLESDLGKVRAAAYDMVLNGNEIAGGSIRIHDPALQARVFKVLGLSDEETKAKFGFLLEALSMGAPPHGGIAFGLDRLSMILSGLDSIRDVIPFPKTHKGTCLMTDSPAGATTEQLKDLHIASIIPTERNDL